MNKTKTKAVKAAPKTVSMSDTTYKTIVKAVNKYSKNKTRTLKKSSYELAEVTGLSQRTIINGLTNMVARNEAKREGAKRSTVYTIL